jgi:hypothetical protein
MKTVSFNTSWITAAVLATCFASANAMAQTAGGLPSSPSAKAVELSDAEAQNLVRRSEILSNVVDRVV